MRALKMPVIAFAILAILGLAIDLGTDDYIHLLLMYVSVNVVLAMSLNLVNGYTGQFSLGHAGFMAIGAYVSAYASTHFSIFPESVNFLNFFIYSTLAGLAAAIAGFLVGQPSLRLRGDYLAIVTLGFGEIIRVALLNLDFLGGARGYSGIPGFPNFYLGFLFSAFWILACFFTIWRLIRSSHGRGFLSVREDEIAAQAMGVNTTQVKVRAFILSSFFAGIAGSIFAHVTSYISPSSFTFLQSVNAVIMVVLGGMGSMSGSIIAAFIITLLPELLRPLQEVTGIDLRMIIYSLSLILIMIVRPQGLLGGTEITSFWRKYVKRSA